MALRAPLIFILKKLFLSEHELLRVLKSILSKSTLKKIYQLVLIDII